MVLDLNKKKGEKKMTPLDLAEEKYLQNMKEYVIYNESFYRRLHLPDEGRQEKLMAEYNNAVSEIVNYLLAKFPESSLNGNNSVEIELIDMNENLSNSTFNMLRVPSYPDIIDIKRGSYPTHFHVKGQFIEEAEEVECLKGLNYLLRNGKINKIFKGLTVKEARSLLDQMNILPKDNELDQVIINHDERTKLYYNFIRSIIYSLLTKAKSTADIRRARLFAASFDVDFDFEPYEAFINEQEKKLALN